MNEIELRKLWDKLQGKINVGDFERFKGLMSDVESRKRFHDKYYNKLKNLGFDLQSYDEYERRLSSNVDTDGGGGNSGGGNSGGGRVSRRYHDCPTGPYTQGCRSEVVRKVQKCIGVKDDSLFGPITQGALESKGFKNGFTDADVSKLCSNDSEENKPTVVLPDWTTCLKNLKKVSLSRDYDNVEIVRVPFANDKGYFWPTKEFLYLYKSGKEIRGSWSCDNSRLIIKTEDGQMWSETNGWETSVRRNNNNDDNNNNNNNINYQDDYTTYDDNEDNYE